MKQITTYQLKSAVKSNPAWATTLTEPVEVTDCCHMEDTAITHLSPLLHFTGKNDGGFVAYFRNCKDLRIAEGNFSGAVNFSGSGIEKIGELKISLTSNAGWAAYFNDCHRLKVAEGSFPGAVSFERAGIETIGELNTGVDVEGTAAFFPQCPNLKVAEGTFPGLVSFIRSGIERIGKLNVTKANKDGQAAWFDGCEGLQTAEGEFSGKVSFQNSGVRRVGRLTITCGVKADFTCCKINLPKEFLGPEYEMDAPLRRRNLGRLALEKAKHQDIEI